MLKQSDKPVLNESFIYPFLGSINYPLHGCQMLKKYSLLPIVIVVALLAPYLLVFPLPVKVPVYYTTIRLLCSIDHATGRSITSITNQYLSLEDYWLGPLHHLATNIFSTINTLRHALNYTLQLLASYFLFLLFLLFFFWGGGHSFLVADIIFHTW